MTDVVNVDALQRQVRLMEAALDVNEQEIIRLTTALDEANAKLTELRERHPMLVLDAGERDFR